MKIVLQLESVGLLGCIVALYAQQFPNSWGVFALLFFAPDLSFMGYAISKKIGAYAYNIIHHQGILVLLTASGWYFEVPLLIQTGLIFLAHSFFDRVFGYGLKYTDSFHHTHLGWIGKGQSV